MDKKGDLAPVVAGLVLGVLIIFMMTLLFKPPVPLSDGDFIDRSKYIKEVQFFLSKYPEAQARIERYHDGSNIVLVIFGVEKNIYEPDYEGLDSFGSTRELALMVEFTENPVAAHTNEPKMSVQCGGPISISESGNTTKLIEKYSWCIEKRIATNINPKISRTEALEIGKKYVLDNLVLSHQVLEFKETPFIVLMPENKTINPLIYVAENGTHYLIDEANNFQVDRPCNISDQNLCYTEDRDSQPYLIGHLVYVFDVEWKETNHVGGGTRLMIDANNGSILYPPSKGAPTSTCRGSLESVKAQAPFTILVPTILPEGYSLQSVDYVPDIYVTMQYFTRSLCDPNNPYSPDEGVIEIVEGPLSQISDAKNGEEYVRTEMAKYEASNFNTTSYVFQDGRMHALGYDTETNYNAHLWIVDENTGTILKIEARSTHTSLEQLVTMGESLKVK